MKESGINKLLELLNQYTKEEKESDIIWELDNDGDICHKYKESVDYNDCIYYAKIPVLISKSYGFIQRLVENDKLKDNGIKPRTDLVKEIQIVDYETGKVLGWKNQYSETEQLIMYLSIQDNPISDLISYLK